MPQRNTPERRNMLAVRAAAAVLAIPGFTASPRRRRYSTRGERGETWRTKKWTPAHLRDRAEALHPKKPSGKKVGTPLVLQFLFAGMHL